MPWFRALTPILLLLAVAGCAPPSLCSTEDGCHDVAAEDGETPPPDLPCGGADLLTDDANCGDRHERCGRGMCSPEGGPVAAMLGRAAESVEQGDGASAVNHLERAYSQAKRDFDRYAERSVAESGMQLARTLAEQGDMDNARECLGIAHHVFQQQNDSRGVQRVDAIVRELNGLAATRSHHRSR